MSDIDKKTPKAPKILKIELKVDEKLAGGEYVNICMVNHSDSEFVLDCFFMQPGRPPKATMKSRLVLTPRNAKRLNSVLTEHIKRFEQKFGKIDIPEPIPPVTIVH